ncbi:MAG: hypothetical protein V3U45_03875 [bacterium]
MEARIAAIPPEAVNVLSTAEEYEECPTCFGTGCVKRLVMLVNGVPVDKLGTAVTPQPTIFNVEGS